MQLQGQILHLEFQIKIDSEPPLALRMLDYWVRLYRLYRIPIQQVLVLLRPPTDSVEIPSAFIQGTTRHAYRILKIWEQDSSLFLKDLSLLPLASLTATKNPTKLLQQVAEQVRTIESTQQRQELSAYSQILAGLRFNKTLIRQVFREGIMRESVIYQEILQEGEQRGRTEGRTEEARSLVLRLLTRRVGTLPVSIEAQVQGLDLPQLEALGEALLDFTVLSDLRNWLQR